MLLLHSNIAQLTLVVLLCVEILEAAPRTKGFSDDCPDPYTAGLCPADCGLKTDANGCRRCLCGVPFFRWPQRNCPNSRRHCPKECGHIMDDVGCMKCFCGTNPFFRFPWVPRTPKKPTLSKHVQTVAPSEEPEFKLDIRTFEGPPSSSPKKISGNATVNHVPGGGHVF